MLLHWITGCIQSSSMDACIFMQIRCPGSSRAGSLNFLVPDDKLEVEFKELQASSATSINEVKKSNRLRILVL